MRDETKCYQSTPGADLEEQIMSPNVPKNEREHWAAREIHRLRDILGGGCPMHPRISLLDRIHVVRDAAEANGQHEFARWFTAHADEACPAVVAQATGAEDPLYCKWCGQGIDLCNDKRRYDHAPCCIDCFHPPEPPAPDASRTDAVKEATLLVRRHEGCADYAACQLAGPPEPKRAYSARFGDLCADADNLRPVVAAIADAEMKLADALDALRECNALHTQNMEIMKRRLADAKVTFDEVRKSWVDARCNALAAIDAPAAEGTAPTMDWEQVRQNGGPPCYWLAPGSSRYCGRAQRWVGHELKEEPGHSFVAAPLPEPANAQGSESVAHKTCGYIGCMNVIPDDQDFCGRRDCANERARCPSEKPPSASPFTAEEARELGRLLEGDADFASSLEAEQRLKRTVEYLRRYADLLEQREWPHRRVCSLCRRVEGDPDAPPFCQRATATDSRHVYVKETFTIRHTDFNHTPRCTAGECHD